MNIENYRLFLRAAKTGSLTAAAEQSGYTQSAVSHVIAGLEKEFGFPLFTRSKTGVTLTQDGERMLIHIREVVNRDDLAHQVANEIKGLRSGRGLAVFGIVDLSAFPLVAFLGETCQDVDTHQFATLQLLVRIVDVELSVAFLQPDNLTVQLVTTLVNLHLRITTFCYPLANYALCVSDY